MLLLFGESHPTLHLLEKGDPFLPSLVRIEAMGSILFLQVWQSCLFQLLEIGGACDRTQFMQDCGCRSASVHVLEAILDMPLLCRTKPQTQLSGFCTKSSHARNLWHMRLVLYSKNAVEMRGSALPLLDCFPLLKENNLGFVSDPLLNVLQLAPPTKFGLPKIPQLCIKEGLLGLVRSTWAGLM